ncbi:phospholipase [Brevundimonas sp. Leaf363]|uniref:phospholipase D-like domain-containing protein n=1 Tax=Brevundimonas sp. Leaf363 TaxID=1736353 RepID=UPI0006F7890B|nr:phospholipase D-like domain-containing protein [Brevundimonas sp. Leaf363]KQS54471.1 phospholipase [Brevundimonas sp. Leaf363]
MTVPTAASQYPDTLLAGPAVWRAETAHRFTPLMENAAYFDALASALHKAQRSIVILGWQFDPRTHLDVQARAGDRHAEIGHQLRMLVKQRPDLDVRLLIWRSPLLIAASQGFYPQKALRWFKKRMVEFRLDSPGPIGACHHQKVVVIDDAVAFCGGGDISVDRWDCAEHLDDDPRRCQPSGLFSAPRHEAMAVMDGPAARALGDLARERWFRATWERTVPQHVAHDPWPTGIEPLLRDVPVGIARTEPKWGGRHEVRENEALHLSAIKAAKSLIYFENQYFTSPVIAQALAERLREPDGPEVVLISTGSSPSWFDKMTMDTARTEVLYRLEQADLHDRFFAFSPRTPAGERIIVHAKLTIIDDRLLRIGSTNLNNRSLGLDTECDIATEVTQEADVAAVRDYRRNSIAHFLGVSGRDYSAAEAVMGSPGRAMRGFDSPRMASLGSAAPTRLEHFVAAWQLGDPTSSSDAWRPWRRRNPSQRRLEG